MGRLLRPLAVLGILALTAGAVFVAVIGGGMSCYDCIERPLEPVFDAVAIVILVLGVVFAIRVARGGKPKAAPPPI